MYNTLGIKTDYSILKSLIKITDLVSFCVINKIPFIGIVDDNLFGSIEFYDQCKKNNINPIIGIDVSIDDKHMYLFAKNYIGYKTLLKINTLIQNKEISIDKIKEYNKDVIMVIPFNVKDFYYEFKDVFNTYISYSNDYEEKNSLILTSKVIPFNICNCLKKNDEYFKILDNIRNDEIKTISNQIQKISESDYQRLLSFSKNINIEIEKSLRHIPKYSNEIKDSFKYLYALCHKGLEKRLGNHLLDNYVQRLNYELKIINEMGFVDYFLIVYDYVKYAKTHNIMVGPGRGSAAGSLVSYSIGITNIDPIKYNLLFERFLNPDRVTMPDIDIDFEDTKRHEMIDYIKKRYGENFAAPIMTFGSLGPRQAILDVAKYYNIDASALTKSIISKDSLKDNLKNEKIQRILKLHSNLKQIYKIAMDLEGIKRQIGTIAAGVAVCDLPLDELVPICMQSGNLLVGLTKDYLEELGILKMDVLAVSNLRIIHNLLDKINNDININKIDFNDKKVLELFAKGDTLCIFQFESEGMRSFLKRLKPSSFSDLYASLALYRPGPMGFIDDFIKRKEGKEKIDYIDERLKDILVESYGIIIYQEQIMLILIKMANYSFSQADNIRRAMSKKKEDIILKEKQHFISNSIKNGYLKEVAESTYDKILKFAEYGFNKSHSVAYAIIAYEQAYLKTYYKEYFIANLFNMNLNNSEKINEYILLAKENDVNILKPSINLSSKECLIENNSLRLPISIIKNVGSLAEEEILKERNKPFLDYFDFVKRCYCKNVNKKVIESLIFSGALDEFKVTRHSLIENIDNAIMYCELSSNLDETLVEKPILEKIEEYPKEELIKQEFNSFGFYINNHPASKYQGKEIVKLNNIENYFNKFIKCVVIIDKVRIIKTKKGDNMAIIKGSDDFSSMEFILFPTSFNLLKNIKEQDLVTITGKVTKRLSDIQITINNMEKISK
ncbi:MAG: DNA polymerase III subunit alpha [Bacilli bacterium]|nr:DNA polymerase III subunit alpha [Bacilli bacterium]